MLSSSNIHCFASAKQCTLVSLTQSCPPAVWLFLVALFKCHMSNNGHMCESLDHILTWRQRRWTKDPTAGHTIKWNVLALGYGSAARNARARLMWRTQLYLGICNIIQMVAKLRGAGQKWHTTAQSLAAYSLSRNSAALRCSGPPCLHSLPWPLVGNEAVSTLHWF